MSSVMSSYCTTSSCIDYFLTIPDPLRRIIRTSLTEALDSTAREAAETLAVTAIGNLIHEMRVSRARMVLRNAAGSALKAASV